MNIFSLIIKLIRAGYSTEFYYVAMNEALKRLNDEYTMLHYPYYVDESDDFLKAQMNLTDYCLTRLHLITGKKVLEVGCGNGVQANYIMEKYKPSSLIGIDLNEANIEIARNGNSSKNLDGLSFLVDDAQKMITVDNQSIDALLNIESAFHYPEKSSFLKEISRVLVPGGHFLIADILTKRKDINQRRKGWKKKMTFHHWHLDNYLDGLKAANLQLTYHEDITPGIIRGYQNYKRWIKEMNKVNFLNDTIFKLFYTINVLLNVRLLKKRHHYYLFVGVKPI